jgi:hypothetical protein
MVLLALIVLAGCAVGAARRVIISGRVTGESITARLAGTSQLVGLQAHVRCNGVAATTAADGSFSLTLTPADRYSCAITPPSAYMPTNITLDNTSGDHISLSFAAQSGGSCATQADPNTFDCPAPPLRDGAIQGTITLAGAGTPASGATVRCVNVASPVNLTFAPPSWLTTQANADGSFMLHGVPVGTYGCVAGSSGESEGYQRIAVRPASASPLTYSLCQSGCPPVTYHDGQVMHSARDYLIFWQPAGYHFDAARGDGYFESTIGQYFRDVGSTPFYSLLAQYWDFQGYIGPSTTLAGVYVDTSPYQHCPIGGQCRPAAATHHDPLYDMDIEAEIHRVLHVRHWSGGIGNEFFVFLADGAQECQDHGDGAACTYVKGNTAFCGYHSWFQDYGTSSPIVYATISDANTARDACLAPLLYQSGTSPHGDWIVDAEISTISHEQFESVTDPTPTNANAGGWYDASAHPLGNTVEEIADRCQDTFGWIRGDGSNITLANGHIYLVQTEWSNAAGACALSA